MEEVPKESETIAKKRSQRLALKLFQARNAIGINREWWSNQFFEIVLIAIIIISNFYVVYPFLGTPAPANSFSGPLFPLLVKITRFFGVQFPYGIQIVNVFFYLLLPLALYIFVRSVCERKISALLASLIVSLPFFPFAQARVNSSLLGTDAAHLASISIIPIALSGLLMFLRKGGAQNLLIASIFSAIIALISPFGFLTYLVFCFVTAFSEALLGSARLKIFRLFLVLLFAGGLNSFWYHPRFFAGMIIGPMGEDIRLTMQKLIPISFFTIPVLGTFGYLLFDRKPNLQSLFLSSFYTIGFLMISLVGGGIFPSHPSRYLHEFGISLSMFLAIIFSKLLDFIHFRNAQFVKNINNKNLSLGASAFLCMALLTVILFASKNVYYDSVQVLGIWDDVEKGNIWIERDRVSKYDSMLGYVISAGCVSGLALINAKELIRK